MVITTSITKPRLTRDAREYWALDFAVFVMLRASESFPACLMRPERVDGGVQMLELRLQGHLGICCDL